MNIVRLYNSKGEYIAYKRGSWLHAPGGKNIGYFRNDTEAFTSSGTYLGHILKDDRLLKRNNYNPGNYGNRGNAGNAGNYGNPGRKGLIGLPSGYEDISKNLLE
ncbi:hypothetical protein V4V34_08990 [Lysinibacillus sphaericus]|uniref:4-fold beta flower protein n=1 Tax=Lysinibacillus sphaericus TaxID=1421 RepID=UPI0018CD4A97|nr:hypothetical protein [Lysinibacillus sphaericus]MBG9756387.1 hypothetical protein [Lysinibacillus sphaericus]QTB12589.1 hypothetical protein J2B92_17255 [Lysinibacillus sphaericus]